MKRRRFLAFVGLAVPSMWIEGVGPVYLPEQVILTLSGQCSFCGKTTEAVRYLAGEMRHPARICNNCVDRCLEVHRNDGVPFHSGMSSPSATEFLIDNENGDIFDFQIPNLSRDVSLPLTQAELSVFIDQWQKLVDQAREDQEQMTSSGSSCSFCDRTQKEHDDLIAGPQAYICKYCISEIAVLMTAIKETLRKKQTGK